MLIAACVAVYAVVGMVAGGVAAHLNRFTQDEESARWYYMLAWPVAIPFWLLYKGSQAVAALPEQARTRAARRALPRAKVVNVLTDKSITYPLGD